jgi:hypothetical protein
MATPRRAEPLRAAATVSEAPAAPQRRSRLRGALVGTGIGFAVGLAAIAIAFSIIAIPLFMLAATDPDRGVDRDLVRKGLFDVALPFGAVTGVAIGLAVGIWYGRGGRLPTDRSPLHGR